MVMLQRWSLMGEWSCYRGDHFNGGKMVRLQSWPVYWKENGHVTEWRANGHFTEVNSLMEGEWLCYGGGQFNGGRKVMLGGQFNGGRMVMLQK